MMINFFLYKEALVSPFHQSTLGTIHKKKPLPKIPLNKLPQDIYTEPPPVPVWIHNNNESNQFHSQLNNLLLTQAHTDHYPYYYYQQQPVYTPNYEFNNPHNNNSNWKTTTNLTRSESLKIETYNHKLPVPFSKTGQLPLETHLEKPFEPTLDDIKALKRKGSKEEVILDQLTSSSSSSSGSSSNTSDLPITPKVTDSIILPPTAQPPPATIHRHSMPLLNSNDDYSFAVTENYFQQASNSSPISSRIPSPWGTKSRSSTLIRERASIPNLMSVKTAQVPDEVIKATTEHYFNEEEYRNNKSTTLSSIASCSLIGIRSNTKLYRRMAIKTRNKEIQMTYATYLLQISKLYDQNSTFLTNNTAAIASSVSLPLLKKTSNKSVIESPAETRHRLLSEAGYWVERLAKAGQPEALFIKGKWHLIGPLAEDCVLSGYEKVQESKAFKCFLASSKAGWVDAHYELAHLWKKRGNYTKAIQCYQKGAREKHTLSIYVNIIIYI